MGNIGITELFVLLLFVGAPITFVLLMRRGRADRRPGSDLVPCGACGKNLSPRAKTCPSCGEPRVVLRG